jgi:hypothetical protein
VHFEEDRQSIADNRLVTVWGTVKLSNRQRVPFHDTATSLFGPWGPQAPYPTAMHRAEGVHAMPSRFMENDNGLGIAGIGANTFPFHTSE